MLHAMLEPYTEIAKISMTALPFRMSQSDGEIPTNIDSRNVVNTNLVI